MDDVQTSQASKEKEKITFVNGKEDRKGESMKCGD